MSARNDDFDSLSVVSPSPAGGSWSGPFRATADDGKDYFVKTLATCPPGQGSSLATERIVALAGRLIGAPTCAVSLIRLPTLLSDYELRPGTQLGTGIAHASLALDHAGDIRGQLTGRTQDDNATRHVGVYALFDWCFGSDNQWLTDIDADQAVYSHDHGLFFPPGSGSLDSAALIHAVDQPHTLPDDPAALDADAIARTAHAVEAVTAGDLLAILGSVPASWPVDDETLETVGWFLYRRREGVAERLRGLV